MWQGDVHGKGGMCGRGACMRGAWQGGHLWWGGMCGRGVCVAGGGGMCGGGMHGKRGMRGRRDGHCSGRYASYRNAFLSSHKFL